MFIQHIELVETKFGAELRRQKSWLEILHDDIYLVNLCGKTFNPIPELSSAQVSHQRVIFDTRRKLFIRRITVATQSQIEGPISGTYALECLP